MPPKKGEFTHHEKERIAHEKKYAAPVALSDAIVPCFVYAKGEVNNAAELWGLIPSFLSLRDPRPARAQIHESYAHGGGWRTFMGHKLNVTNDEIKWFLSYPGDRPAHIISVLPFRDERIALFDYSWVAIVQPDNTYVIARID